MTTYLRFYDERTGDVYELYVDHDGDFFSAARSVGAFGRDIIYYDELKQIPPSVRNQIEQLLAENKDGK